MLMNNIVGQPVEGDDFFDRETDVDAVWESLEQGNHVLLLAPRRVGKTSLALRVGERALSAGWRFAFVDVQRDRDELSLLANLFENLKSAGLKVPLLARLTQAVAWARRTLRGKVEGGGLAIEIGGEEGQESFTLEALVDHLFKQLEESDHRVLIAMDELPLFLTELQREEKGEDETVRLRRFLNWFRALRLRFRKNVRWLLLGSVGLDTFAESRRLTRYRPGTWVTDWTGHIGNSLVGQTQAPRRCLDDLERDESDERATALYRRSGEHAVHDDGAL